MIGPAGASCGAGPMRYGMFWPVDGWLLQRIEQTDYRKRNRQ